MHRDKKIGFALGILLIGIVAALFFRNEPDPFAALPPLDDPASLDGKIAEKPISPYTEELNKTDRSTDRPVNGSQFDVPEFYRPAPAAPPFEAGPPAAPAAPAPINLEKPVVENSEPVKSIIEVGNPFANSARNQSARSDQKLPGNENWTSVPEKPPAAPPRANPVSRSTNGQKASRETVYKVQKGDTLSVLAEKHLGSSRRFMEIYEANRDKLKDPDDIKVGMSIRIPARVSFDGKPTEAPKTETNRPRRAGSYQTLPPPEEASRFRPFSRAPLGPMRY